MQKQHVLGAVTAAIAFAAGASISFYVSANPGTSLDLDLLGHQVSLKARPVDLDKLLQNPARRDEARIAAIKRLKLYDIDQRLVDRIKSLNYDHAVSDALRDMRDRFVGPFNAPERPVRIRFDPSMAAGQVAVCPQSPLYGKPLHLAREDLSAMISLTSKSQMLQFGCPQSADWEPIQISTSLAEDLLGTDSTAAPPPEAVLGFAKELPELLHTFTATGNDL